MWKDRVLEEIYNITEQHRKAFNFYLKAICDDFGDASSWWHNN